MKRIFLLFLLSLFLYPNTYAQVDKEWTIKQESAVLKIRAGRLTREIDLSGSRMLPGRFAIGEKEVGKLGDAEISFRLLEAAPDWKPDLIKDGTTDRYTTTEASFGKTDELKIKQVDTGAKGVDQWKEVADITTASWNRVFRLTDVYVSDPVDGTQKAMVRFRGNGTDLSDDFSVTLNYEIYKGFPVVRQWVEFVNNTDRIYKIDRLFLSRLTFGNALPQSTPLTPDDRAVSACIRAFSSADSTEGVIIGSEVPSATRYFEKETGRLGYVDKYFEWIMTPSEAFVSEPVSFYAYSGKVYPTVSAVSTPLDRCVDREYKDFLDRCVGVVANRSRFYVPRYSTWSNYAFNISEELCRKIIPIAADCGFKLFEIDDGWQKDRLGTEKHPVKFKDLEGIGEMLREKGMDLGIWASCYRAKDSKDVKAMPGSYCQPMVKRLGGFGMSFASDWKNYFAQDLVYVHDRYGAKFFKEDFSNIIFGDEAFGHDSRSKKESYLQALRGLLSAQMRIRELCPEITTMISHEIYWGTPGVSCDLAAMKTTSCFHIPPNDYSGLGGSSRATVADYKVIPPTKEVQEALYRGCLNARNRYFMHRGLPLHMLEYYGAATANVNGALTPEIQDRQICSFLMGIPTVYAGDLLTLTPENTARYRQRFALVEEYQEKYGIYRHFQYSGVPAPTDKDWHWWGKLDKEGRGVVVVLRGTEGKDERAVNIPWVLPDRKYTVKSLFTGEVLGKFSGKALQQGKLKLRLPVMGQDILAVE